MLFTFLVELLLSDTGMIKEDSYIMVVLPVVTGNIMADVSLVLQLHMWFPIIPYQPYSSWFSLKGSSIRLHYQVEFTVILKVRTKTIPVKLLFCIIKGYFRYKIIFCHKVALNV